MDFELIQKLTMRRSFTIARKLEILEEQNANALSNNEICRRHGLNLNQLNKWKESRPNFILRSKRLRSLHPGNQSIYKEHESAIVDYIHTRRAATSVVTARSVINRLQELTPTSANSSYKARQMWLYRFMQREGFSIRRITRTVSISDSELNSRRMCFYEQIMQRHFRNNATIFVNMDQTSVAIASLAIATIEVTGARAVQIQSTDKQSDRLTAALAVASNGEKLQPFAIFKGTVNGRVRREFSRQNNPFPQNIVYSTNENAWMTRELMKEWIRLVLVPFAEQYGNNNVCLILDSFQVHRDQSIANILQSLEIEVIFIPGGMTAELQPLDIGINAPFKHYLREATIEDIAFANLSASEKRFKAANAISKAWNDITRDTVINSFNRTLLPTFTNIEDADEIE